MTAHEPAARERDEVFLELTKSICPVCKTTIDAEVNVRNDQVFLRKRCAEHGEFEHGCGDAQMYVDAQRFNKPGTRPLQTQTEVKDGCPQDCGLCPPAQAARMPWDHRGQHRLQPGLPHLLRRLPVTSPTATQSPSGSARR